MIQMAIRRLLSSGQFTVARLTADPRVFQAFVTEARQIIPVPIRWFVRKGQIEQALHAAIRAAASSDVVRRSSAAIVQVTHDQRVDNGHHEAADPAFERAREHLAGIGIQLDGQLPTCTVLIQLQKSDWNQPRPYEIGRVTQEGTSYEVLMMALPYFLGPNWREASEGGKPQLVVCDTVQELIELLEFTPGAFVRNGVLHDPG